MLGPGDLLLPSDVPHLHQIIEVSVYVLWASTLPLPLSSPLSRSRVRARFANPAYLLDPLLPCERGLPSVATQGDEVEERVHYGHQEH